jgi:DNA-binding response OmpR family regulator
MTKILVVSQEKQDAVKVAEALDLKEMNLVFVDTVMNGSTHVKEIAYDLIILGDKLGKRGDTYDVGLEIKQSKKNKHTPVMCIGPNTARALNLVNLLRPSAFRADPSDPKTFVDQLQAWVVSNNKALAKE